MKQVYCLLLCCVLIGCESESTMLHYPVSAADELSQATVANDKNMRVTQNDGVVTVAGTTSDTSWAGDGMRFPVADRGGATRASIKFHTPRRDAPGRVALGLVTEQAGELLILFDWERTPAVYRITRRVREMNEPFAVELRTLPAFGDEEHAYHTLHIEVSNDRRDVSFYVDDTLLDSVRFSQEVGWLKSITARLETAALEKSFEVQFKDMTVHSHVRK